MRDPKTFTTILLSISIITILSFSLSFLLPNSPFATVKYVGLNQMFYYSWGIRINFVLNYVNTILIVIFGILTLKK